MANVMSVGYNNKDSSEASWARKVGLVTLKVEAECNQTAPRLRFTTNPGNFVSKAEADKFGRWVKKKPGIQTGPKYEVCEGEKNVKTKECAQFGDPLGLKVNDCPCWWSRCTWAETETPLFRYTIDHERISEAICGLHPVRDILLRGSIQCGNGSRKTIGCKGVIEPVRSKPFFWSRCRMYNGMLANPDTMSQS